MLGPSDALKAKGSMSWSLASSGQNSKLIAYTALILFHILDSIYMTFGEKRLAFYDDAITIQ